MHQLHSIYLRGSRVFKIKNVNLQNTFKADIVVSNACIFLIQHALKYFHLASGKKLYSKMTGYRNKILDYVD